MSDDRLIAAMATALEAAAEALRRSIATTTLPMTADAVDGDVVERARLIHPALGPRQAQVLRVLDEAGATGTTAGAISRSIDYDQPNVYLALGTLVRLGLAQKDTTTDPHTYRVGRKLVRIGASAAVAPHANAGDIAPANAHGRAEVPSH